MNTINFGLFKAAAVNRLASVQTNNPEVLRSYVCISYICTQTGHLRTLTRMTTNRSVDIQNYGSRSLFFRSARTCAFCNINANCRFCIQEELARSLATLKHMSASSAWTASVPRSRTMANVQDVHIVENPWTNLTLAGHCRTRKTSTNARKYDYNNVERTMEYRNVCVRVWKITFSKRVRIFPRCRTCVLRAFFRSSAKTRGVLLSSFPAPSPMLFPAAAAAAAAAATRYAYNIYIYMPSLRIIRSLRAYKYIIMRRIGLYTYTGVYINSCALCRRPRFYEIPLIAPRKPYYTVVYLARRALIFLVRAAAIVSE